MGSWERFDETSLPDKEAFYSSLNMENITDIDYRHANRVFKTLQGVQGDTVLLADVFEAFRAMCIEIYEIDPVYFLSAPGLVWQVCLKKHRSRTKIVD